VHGGSCTCGFSSGSGTPFGPRPQVALSQVNPLIQEPPLQLTEPSFASSFLLFLAQRAHLPPEARTRPEPWYLRAVYSVKFPHLLPAIGAEIQEDTGYPWSEDML
jgi:hypothetical protein